MLRIFYTNVSLENSSWSDLKHFIQNILGSTKCFIEFKSVRLKKKKVSQTTAKSTTINYIKIYFNYSTGILLSVDVKKIFLITYYNKVLYRSVLLYNIFVVLQYSSYHFT